VADYHSFSGTKIMATTYTLSLSADQKTAYLTLGGDAIPGGATDLGTFVHDSVSDPLGIYAGSHSIANHVQEILARTSKANPAVDALQPGGIYNLGDISLEYYGTNAQTTGIYSTRNEIALVGTGNLTFQIKRKNNDAVIASGLTVTSSNPAVATYTFPGSVHTVTGVAAGSTQINVSSTLFPWTLVIPVKVT
jgi:hypothetical protein